MPKVNFNELIDPDEFKQMVSEKYIRTRRHPTEPYTIANYTEKAQYDRVWNTATRTCRGLIFDDDGKIIARPFAKFFNLGDPESGLDLEAVRNLFRHFKVYEKADGSLGILNQLTDGSWAIATRGSFESQQAVWATEHLNQHHTEFQPEPGLTYLFEIIYPENRVVVDYKGKEMLVALAAIDNKSGRVVPDVHKLWTGPIVEEYQIEDGLEELIIMERPNKEGFVLHDPASDLRLKIKHAEYVRLHRLITGMSSRSIWDLLATGTDLRQVISSVPEEMQNWVADVGEGLEMNTAALVVRARIDVAKILRETGMDQGALKTKEGRKAFALHATKTKHPSALFTIIDDRDVWAWAWKQTRPEEIVRFSKFSEDTA
jgi:RNA ligase